MLNQKKQEDKIESMRARLHELVMSKAGNLIDEEVGELSAQLDKLIVKYQKTMAKPTQRVF
ncbi:aspartyl-phosphate phosphatase Spo0E family protein [Pelosinus sp. sgz500959]|uniref:aspartyl-phosphate phosphatase Spo0E family protein n=1 Tax=Pelosinus sp. sgz500959 TaxID=3242472 RepID=UPI003671E972